ncbi:hypothetical protein [Breznakia pachnodae]|uniref:Transposase n=1 Tax=Breznakia pachnodae TaxID=265178 RepID=A0ABU0E5B4_9FIRM|nr:hypothetical protein [Breznakia pachnodae]MDQ0361883.1 hypothetical protein [Breznakia pachnodae]
MKTSDLNESWKKNDNSIKKSEGNRKEAVFAKGKQEPQYLAIKELHEDKGWSINWLCNVYGIARSSYYKWLNRKP